MSQKEGAEGKLGELGGIGMTSIRKLPQLNDKIVRFVYPDADGNFFLVACHDYDQFLDIIYSETDKCEVDFYRNIEPNIIDVHDMNT